MVCRVDLGTLSGLFPKLDRGLWGMLDEREAACSPREGSQPI